MFWRVRKPQKHMTELVLYFWVVVGILISVLMPVFVKWMKDIREDTSKSVGDWIKKAWELAKPYVKAMLGSMVLGLFVLAIYRAGLGGDKVIDTWAKALLYGYTWDSTFQKFVMTS
ncbi:hypothetical protein RIVM261_025920 [Rivularia sp. IAM M-261]|nr:hypothetical protein RIVM261_025920 [Rivularia sp. IAM M-261]